MSFQNPHAPGGLRLVTSRTARKSRFQRRDAGTPFRVCARSNARFHVDDAR